MKSLNAYDVARAMLILEDRNSAGRIARELGVAREAVSYWLTRMREERLVERQRRTTTGGGYEWWLTDRGQAMAIYKRPEEAAEICPPERIRYNHRPLAAALGIPDKINPPPGRTHILEGGR